MQLNKIIKLSSPPSFLVVRLRQMGDSVLSLPLLETLRQNFPAARIDFVIEKKFAPLVRLFPQVNDLHIFNRAWDKLPLKARLLHYLAFYRKLRSRRYDAVIDLMGNPRSIMIAYGACATYRIGHKKLHNLFFSRRLDPLSAPAHTSDRLLNLLSPLKLALTVKDLKLPLPEKLLQETRAKFGLKEKCFAVVCPGSNKRLWSAWPPENYCALVRPLSEQIEVRVICGPAEADLAVLFRKHFADNANVVVEDDNLTLPELCALIRMSALFVGNNSGPLHLAAAADTPAIGIFGPGSPEDWGLRHLCSHNFWKALPCSPCSHSRCAYPTRRCLEEIKAEEVLAKALELLKRP